MEALRPQVYSCDGNPVNNKAWNKPDAMRCASLGGASTRDVGLIVA